MSLQINGHTKTPGVDYRSGIETDMDGTYTLVLWLPLSATEPAAIQVGSEQ